MIKISVQDGPRELRAVVLALSRAPAEIRKAVNTDLRTTMNPAWRSEIPQHLTGSGLMEGRILNAGVRIAGGNPPQLIAANSRRTIGHGGGLVPSDDWQGWEYGASRDDTTEMTNNKGTTYTRHTKRHLPARRRNGRVLGPSVAAILPRVCAYWAQTVVRVFMDALEGKTN